MKVWLKFLLFLMVTQFGWLAPETFRAQAQAEKYTRTEPLDKSVLSGFRLQTGFRIEVIASEPMIAAPLAIAFDAKGRLFVVERAGSLGGTGPASQAGRVRVLGDFDAQGVPRTSTVYAEDVAWASAIACYGDGAFVAAGKEIRYFKDSKGDGVADIDQSVLAGFGGTNDFDGRRLINNLNWGLDHRFHAATAGAGGAITSVTAPAKAVSLEGSDLSFDPRTLEVFPELGTGQSGMTFDDHGNRFVSDLTHPLRMPLFEFNDLSRNPFFAKAPAMFDVVGPGTTIYRLAAQANRAPTGNRATAAVEACWFNQARGSVIYRGSAFPAGYRGNAFIADPEARAVHRAVLRESGLMVTGEVAADEHESEFLFSSDSTFRPVQVVNGPEGALYVVDHQDREDRGRIYRIVPAGFKQVQGTNFASATSYALVAALASPDGWRADTAARLLFERQDPAAIPLLTNMVGRAKVDLARLRALRVLGGLGVLSESVLIQALQDTDPAVRQHAVRLVGRAAVEGAVSGEIWGILSRLTADPAPSVRFQLASVLGEIRRPETAVALGQILVLDGASPWVQTAVLSSLANGGADLFGLLAGNANFRRDPAAFEFLKLLATMMGEQGRLGEVTVVKEFLVRANLDGVSRFALLAALGDGLNRTRSSLHLSDPQGALQPVFAQAIATAIDSTVAERVRLEAIRLLGFSSYTLAEVGDWLLLLLSPPSFPSIQSNVIETLSHYNDLGVVTGLQAQCGNLSPGLRNQAIGALLSHQSRLLPTLDAIQAGRIPAGDLSATQLNFLRTSRYSAVRERAERMFGPLPVRRPEVVAQFKSALDLKGQVAGGRQIFGERCANCHQFRGFGTPFGPELSGIGTRPKETILSSIIEPNAEIAPGYATDIVESREGETLLGIKTEDNVSTVTLLQPGRTKVVWPWLNIQTEQPQSWSLMPTGLERGLTAQNMADLLEFLTGPPR